MPEIERRFLGSSARSVLTLRVWYSPPIHDVMWYFITSDWWSEVAPVVCQHTIWWVDLIADTAYFLVYTIYSHNEIKTGVLFWELINGDCNSATAIADVMKKTVINGKTKPLSMLECRSWFQMSIKTVGVELTILEPHLFWDVDRVSRFVKSCSSKCLLQALFEPATTVGRRGLSLWLETNRVLWSLSVKLYSVRCFQFKDFQQPSHRN
jgi:hypothetical protein